MSIFLLFSKRTSFVCVRYLTPLLALSLLSYG
jgi:hypothetical protein